MTEWEDDRTYVAEQSTTPGPAPADPQVADALAIVRNEHSLQGQVAMAAYVLMYAVERQRAELARLRPVVDAARAWKEARGDRSVGSERYVGACRALSVAVAGLDGPATPTPAEPGYERIAEALVQVFEAADLDVKVWRSGAALGGADAERALARTLDKAGLIDWSAFTGGER